MLGYPQRPTGSQNCERRAEYQCSGPEKRWTANSHQSVQPERRHVLSLVQVNLALLLNRFENAERDQSRKTLTVRGRLVQSHALRTAVVDRDGRNRRRRVVLQVLERHDAALRLDDCCENRGISKAPSKLQDFDASTLTLNNRLRDPSLVEASFAFLRHLAEGLRKARVLVDLARSGSVQFAGRQVLDQHLGKVGRLLEEGVVVLDPRVRRDLGDGDSIRRFREFLAIEKWQSGIRHSPFLRHPDRGRKCLGDADFAGSEKLDGVAPDGGAARNSGGVDVQERDFGAVDAQLAAFLEREGGRRATRSVQGLDVARLGVVEEAESVSADSARARLGQVESGRDGDG